MRGIEFVLACLVDFIADDGCHVCGRRHRTGASPLVGGAAAVAGEVRVGPVTNHPVCARCALRLVPATTDTVAGWLLPGGAVLTRAHDVVLAPAGSHPPIQPGALRLASAFHTNDTLLRLIHVLKFSRVTSLVPGLAGAMATAAGPAVRCLDRPLLVPVPMDRRSRRRRGFNQSESIAAELARRWGIPLATAALAKPAPTAPQSLARRDRRLKNVLGAYVPGPDTVRGRDVILVDDLVTTGSTAAVVAGVLGGCGAATVTVVSAGRAL